MSPLNRRYTLEALIATSILALLLMLMMPRFFSAQKFGPISRQKCQYLSGKWEWKDDVVTAITTQEQSLLLFSPEYESSEFSCKVLTDENEGVEILFGFKDNRQESYLWNVGTRDSEKQIALIRSCKVFDPVNRLIHKQWMLDDVPGSPLAEELPSGKWNEIRLLVQAKRKHIHGFVNDKHVLDYVASRPLDGKYGFYSWGSATKYKDMKVMPVD